MPWIAGADEDRVSEDVAASFRAAGLDPPLPVFRTDSVSFAINLVMQCNALFILPSETVRREVASGQLVAIDVQEVAVGPSGVAECPVVLGVAVVAVDEVVEVERQRQAGTHGIRYRLTNRSWFDLTHVRVLSVRSRNGPRDRNTSVPDQRAPCRHCAVRRSWRYPPAPHRHRP